MLITAIFIRQVGGVGDASGGGRTLPGGHAVYPLPCGAASPAQKKYSPLFERHKNYEPMRCIGS